MPTENETTVDKFTLVVGAITLASVAALSIGVTYLVTAGRYQRHIDKMHLVAHDAGLLDQLIEYQNAHPDILKNRKFNYVK